MHRPMHALRLQLVIWQSSQLFACTCKRSPRGCILLGRLPGLWLKLLGRVLPGRRPRVDRLRSRLGAVAWKRLAAIDRWRPGRQVKRLRPRAKIPAQTPHPALPHSRALFTYTTWKESQFMPQVCRASGLPKHASGRSAFAQGSTSLNA